MAKLTLGSLFDGQGTFPLGGLLSGIEPVRASEVEVSAVRVTKNRFPNITFYGDVSKMKGSEIEPVDIITFGSPCQSVSVAGKRNGIKHTAKGDEETTRSGLFFEALRIIEEMRGGSDGKYPRYAVLENVLGIFSSSKGEDFRRVLEEFCQVVDANAEVPKLDKWPLNGEIIGNGYSIAYRVFDAQFWGVPQRRRRVYLLADFNGYSAGKIMFRNEGEKFHSRWNAWTDFAKDKEATTAYKLVNEFNGLTYDIPPREENEPSGKFAKLDMGTGVWDSEIPEGYFIGEKPRYQNPTKLSEILAGDADPKYNLSKKACEGILRRAAERRRELPDVLQKALENQANRQ